MKPAKAMAYLKSETRAFHDQTEDTAVARRMFAGSISGREYVSVHWAYFKFHRALERAVLESSDPLIAETCTSMSSKAERLENDLHALSRFRLLRSPSLSRIVSANARELQNYDGPSLIGALYVMEGSALGGLMLAPRMEAGIGLAAHEMSYYGTDKREVIERWRNFGARVDKSMCAAQALSGAAESARGTFAAVGDVFTAIAAANSRTRRPTQDAAAPA